MNHLLAAMRRRVGWRMAVLLAALVALSPNALPLSVTENFRRAEAASAAGDYAAAADALANAAARLPYDGYLEYRAGLADISAQLFEPAIRRLRRAGDLLGWNMALRVALGDAYLGYGDRAAAVEQWELALSDLPADRALLTRLANNYEALGRYPDAIHALNRQAQAGDADPALLYRLALLTAVTEPVNAIARLNVVINVPGPLTSQAQSLLQAVEGGLNEGDDAYTFGRVGYVLIQLKEWALAEHALVQAVTLNPEYADANAYLGLALDMQKKDGEAAYAEAVRLQPDSPLAQYLFGLHYRQAGESTRALPYLQAAQKLDPENPAIAAEIAGAYTAQNDLINAEAWFSKAVTLAPGSAEFWLLLARFHVDNDYKVVEQGLPAARMAVGLDPNSAPAADALGYALVLTGDFVNGEKSLQKALQLDPNLASAYYHYGLFYTAQNKTEQAKDALNHALALDPQGPVGSLALKALATLP